MFYKRLASIVLTMVMLLTIAIPAQASTSLADSLDNIVAYYQSHQTTLSSWEEAVALRSAGVDLKQSPWKAPNWNLSSLGAKSQATDYAGVVLGMLACGQDPTNADGQGLNLVSKLAAMQQSSGSFAGPLNQTVLSVIALDTAQAPYQADKAVAYIIGQHKPDGGYALSGSKADADITGLTLIALAKHSGDTGVAAAISQAKAALKKIQQSDGGFCYGSLENAESTATVIRGLTACGENVTASGWTKKGKTVVDALFSFQLKDHSFAHTKGGKSAPMATRQALNAVADLVNGNVFANIESGSNPRPYGWSDVRVRVEGATANLADTTVRVKGSALDALKQAVGSSNVQFDSSGMVDNILGKSANFGTNPPTSWLYYVIRNGSIDMGSLSNGVDGYTVQNGDQVVFYIGTFGTAPSYEAKTYLPVVSISPQQPTAGQAVTFRISAQKYDWSQGLQNLSAAETKAIGEYTVTVNGKAYKTSYGQVTIPQVSQGTLRYSITNQNSAGYPNVVPFRGSITVGSAVLSTARVRVEGAVQSLDGKTVKVLGSAMDALKAAVGDSRVIASGGYISAIDGVSGNTGGNPATSWFYYVIRQGAIDPLSLNIGADGYNVQSGDQVIFFIGAYDPVTYAGKTYYPVVSVSPKSPRAGDNVTLRIKAQKNDWAAGLVDLSAAEARAVGDYTVYANGKVYISHNGQVVIPSVAAGTLSFTVTNPNPAGYPDVVTYKGSVQVAAAAKAGATTTAAAAGSGLVLASGSSQSEAAAGSDQQQQTQESSQVQQDQPKQEGSSHTWVWPVSGVAIVAALVILYLSRRKQ